MFSTRQAAKKLGLGAKTLSHYIAVGKVPSPTVLKVGSASLHAWTEKDIEHVRKLLPKIKNGRKTRYQKEQSARHGGQSAKARPKRRKQPQPRAAVLQEKKHSVKPKLEKSKP